VIGYVHGKEQMRRKYGDGKSVQEIWATVVRKPRQNSEGSDRYPSCPPASK
jgi:hypothetical protein